MKKPAWFFSDAVIGLLISLIIIGLYFTKISFIEGLEYKMYDFRAKMRQTKKPNDKIAIIAIDEKSIANIGRWPWPRSIIAELINKVNQSQPRVVGLNILLTEADRNQGLDEIRYLKQNYVTMMFQLQKKLKLKNDKEMMSDFLVLMSSSESLIDNDAILANSIESAGNVVLPMFFALGRPLTSEQEETADSLAANTLKNIEKPKVQPKNGTGFIEAYSPMVPFENFSSVSKAIGHSNSLTDSDGEVRREILLVDDNGKYYPSFALQLARIYMGLPLDSIKVSAVKKEINIGNVNIPLDENMNMLIDFAGPTETYQYFSVFDVLTDKIPKEVFKNKIVIIGYMATGLADMKVVPVSSNFPGTELTANIIQDILEKRFIMRPDWAPAAEIIMLVLCALFITLLLSKLKAKWSSIISFIMLAVIIAAGIYLFRNQAQWIKIFYPVFLLAVGYTVITSKKFLLTEKRKELIETESIETNKMLGLSFQGQGMLDLAFEKFRKCPIDDSIKELLYNLALDFERKRQFNKAVAVYEHIQTADPKYKNVEERIKMLKNVSEGAVLGIGPKKTKSETVIIDGASSQKPTLGRYEIIKELGRGAMGVVYLGQDPKINRTVAIKTLRFEDDVSEAEMKSVKERFFREAESAGKLSHPHIVRIFDAGEDYDVSYIAMELLDGKDMKEFCEKDKLLPIKDVITYVSQVADALDYAHQQGVIHRDIKPANIMLLKDGALRVTDFGIARIMASSKTQTGTVLGTPSYMSPEQISGKKVDGRSDLFSLGVMLYELLTGKKPFEGDNIATLLFQITNAAERNPREIKADIPECLVRVTEKALKKNPDERYQRGKEMVDDLLKCMQVIQGTAPDLQPPAKTAVPPDATVKISSPAAEPSETVKISPPASGTVKLDTQFGSGSGTVKLTPEEIRKRMENL